MKIAMAKLIKLKTEDGFFQMKDHIEVGKLYVVDLDSIHVARGMNLLLMCQWDKEIISTLDGRLLTSDFGAVNGWLPTEIIEIIGE